MKYFTSEWWASGCVNAEAIFASYQSYLGTIRSGLPVALKDLEASHTLHDAEVKRIRNDFSRGEVEITLHGWDINFQHPVRYTLQFSEALLFEQIFPQQEHVEEELGDLGYWECEIVSSGIEVRMLFVSSAEFRIVFKAFAFSHEKLRA